MQLNQPSPKPEAGRDLPSMAQIFGTVFAVLTAIVTAANLAGLAAAILAAIAATFACMALYVGFNRAPWTSRKQGQFVGALLGAILLTATAVGPAVLGNDDDRQADSSASTPSSEPPAIDEQRDQPSSRPESSPPDKVIEKTSYSMVASSVPLTNDRDKVDLDTGCPGWGPTSIPVGRGRCGEVADLILEPDSIHTFEKDPLMALLDDGQQATWATCHDTLTADTTTIGEVQLSELRPGSELCVLTDKDNVAAVHVVDMSDGLVIGFEVWG